QARKNLMFAKRCTKQTYLLQGLIRCAKDGLQYRGHQEKSDVIYYYCKSRANNTPQENCKSPYLRADQIEPMVWDTVKSILENPEEVFNTFRDESILNEERAKSIEGRLDYISDAIKKLEVAKKRITEAFKAEAMTLPEFRKEKTDIELSEEKLISERDALMMKLNVQHDVSAKIDLFKETCHKFLSKINDPKIVTERLKKDIIKLIIDEVVIEGERVKIFATIPLPNKIHEREMDKTDIPGTFNAGATLGPVNETNMTRIWNKHKQSNTPLKRKVFVAMSGGVDSSVAALLLKKKGYNVVGVYMKGWSLTGCAEEDAADARRVASKLNIPFYIFNFEDEYKKIVVDYMISGYAKGETPNPDVMCNKEIKFGLFLKKALLLGADFIATGHYVRKVVNKLVQAKDGNKDQSYFLWTLTQNQLKYCLFPIGDYNKPQVRALAKKWNLPTAEKPDSQGVCFVGEIDVVGFLKEKLGKNSGPIKTINGETIGSHDGAIFYTIGQRRGIGIKGSLPGEQGKIYYVAAKDLKTNTIFVAEGKDENLFANKLTVKNINWISGKVPELPLKCLARIRYRQPLQNCVISSTNNKSNTNKRIFVDFSVPQRAVTPGQSAVFYLPSIARRAKEGDDLVMLGGGIIE
ncbi:MAG: tRNA 2-thiouridine(34) synthase MnmA, partial [Candidatus Azambacteria bacterium]|nr:tRNA 2-thiouridine(34) synthase MnmA [Candidatus Azambacteria bacterium]